MHIFSAKCIRSNRTSSNYAGFSFVPLVHSKQSCGQAKPKRIWIAFLALFLEAPSCQGLLRVAVAVRQLLHSTLEKSKTRTQTEYINLSPSAQCYLKKQYVVLPGCWRTLFIVLVHVMMTNEEDSNPGMQFYVGKSLE